MDYHPWTLLQWLLPGHPWMLLQWLLPGHPRTLLQWLLPGHPWTLLQWLLAGHPRTLTQWLLPGHPRTLLQWLSIRHQRSVFNTAALSSCFHSIMCTEALLLVSMYIRTDFTMMSFVIAVNSYPLESQRWFDPF